ncbi:unnamed protein product [Gordionus sp. m RMFG-2023]|uniref:transcription initiation factor TFIID subunit 7-like n=1 Tax=Gordionus sp. m RMFG-2023 TaxID=3053472 RepID=UPI0030E5CD58
MERSKINSHPFDSENLFIIKLPEDVSEEINNKFMNKETINIKDILFLDLDVDNDKGRFKFKDQILFVKLHSLPCIIECLKTLDRKVYYKTGDISQLLVCQKEPYSDNEVDEHQNNPTNSLNSFRNRKDKEKKYNWNHGITPPLKNVRKRRFRKIIKKKTLDLPQIEKEVRRLLQVDNEAENVTWELLFDHQEGAPTGLQTSSIPLSSETSLPHVTTFSNIEDETRFSLEYSVTSMATEKEGKWIKGGDKEPGPHSRSESGLMANTLGVTDLFGESFSSFSGSEDERVKEIDLSESDELELEEDGDEDLDEEEEYDFSDGETEKHLMGRAESGQIGPDHAYLSCSDLIKCSTKDDGMNLIPTGDFIMSTEEDVTSESSLVAISNFDTSTRTLEIQNKLRSIQDKRFNHLADLQCIENPALRQRFQNMLDVLEEEETNLKRELQTMK